MFLNPEVILPIVFLFILVQSRKSISLPVRLLHGIKLFVNQHFYGGAPQQPKEKQNDNKEKDEDEIPVEQLLTNSDITMTEIDYQKAESSEFIKSLYYHSFLEILLYLFSLAVLSHIVSSVQQCLYPTASAVSFNWTMFYFAFTLFFSFQCQLLLLAGTGWKEFEVKVAVGIGIFFFVLYSILTLFGLNTFTASTFFHISLHIKALLLQISSAFPLPNDDTFQRLVHLGLNFCLGLLATALTVPIMRFTLTLHKMTLGKKFEQVSTLWKTLCSLDFVLPFLITILFSPGVNRLLHLQIASPCSTSEESQTCSVLEMNPPPTVSSLFWIQIGCLCLLASTKLLTFTKHIQSYMDFSVETASLIFMIKDMTLKQNLLLILTYRSRYLVALAFEYLSFPLQLISLIFLMIRSIPQGLGVSSALQYYLPNSMPISESAAATEALINYNTTAVAFERASDPYLMDGLFNILGIVVIPDDVPMKDLKKFKAPPRSLDLLYKFAQKFSQIYYLPPKVSLIAFQEIIFNIFLLWSLLNIFFFIVWVLYPEPLRKKLSSPK